MASTSAAGAEKLAGTKEDEEEEEEEEKRKRRGRRGRRGYCTEALYAILKQGAALEEI